MKIAKINFQRLAFLKLRFVMAFIFLWAFVDKVFGLGFGTPSERAWINGGSPTAGFLANSPKGPFADIFNSLAGVGFVDWIFMLGLLFVGITFAINRYVLWGGIAGVIMMMLMWLAVLPPENNPIVDEHIVYALVLFVYAMKSRGGENGLRAN